MNSSMTITNAQYLLSSATGENGSIKCIADGEHVSVPMNPANRYYAEIMRQVEAGDLTIEDAV